MARGGPGGRFVRSRTEQQIIVHMVQPAPLTPNTCAAVTNRGKAVKALGDNNCTAVTFRGENILRST